MKCSYVSQITAISDILPLTVKHVSSFKRKDETKNEIFELNSSKNLFNLEIINCLFLAFDIGSLSFQQ